MTGMTAEEWDLRFFAKHARSEVERAVYQRRLDDFLAAKMLEHLNEKDPLQAGLEELKRTGKPKRIKATTDEERKNMVLGPFGFVDKDEL